MTLPNPSSIIPILKTAGQKILAIYEQKEAFSIEEKADHSPLTSADLASHHALVNGLKNIIPQLPILSEESGPTPFEERRKWHRYWLIDPLDGTREFIGRHDDFSINVALIEENQPIMGLVYVPVFDTLYTAVQGKGAYKQVQNRDPEPISTTPYQGGRLRITISRQHSTEKLRLWLSGLTNYEIIPRGSALKICLVAEGVADLYLRFGRTSEWDTAAGQCILEEAGGALIDLTARSPLRYNTKESFLNPDFLAVGDKTVDWFKLLLKTPYTP